MCIWLPARINRPVVFIFEPDPRPTTCEWIFFGILYPRQGSVALGPQNVCWALMPATFPGTEVPYTRHKGPWEPDRAAELSFGAFSSKEAWSEMIFERICWRHLAARWAEMEEDVSLNLSPPCGADLVPTKSLLFPFLLEIWLFSCIIMEECNITCFVTHEMKSPISRKDQFA